MIKYKHKYHCNRKPREKNELKAMQGICRIPSSLCYITKPQSAYWCAYLENVFLVLLQFFCALVPYDVDCANGKKIEKSRNICEWSVCRFVVVQALTTHNARNWIPHSI